MNPDYLEDYLAQLRGDWDDEHEYAIHEYQDDYEDVFVDQRDEETIAAEAKAKEEKLVLKKNQKIAKDIEYYQKIAAENPEAVKKLLAGITKKQDIDFNLTDDELYEVGYKDGKANEKDSILWLKVNYQLGWKDGEGDRLYE